MHCTGGGTYAGVFLRVEKRFLDRPHQPLGLTWKTCSCTSPAPWFHIYIATNSIIAFCILMNWSPWKPHCPTYPLTPSQTRSAPVAGRTSGALCKCMLHGCSAACCCWRRVLAARPELRLSPSSLVLYYPRVGCFPRAHTHNSYLTAKPTVLVQGPLGARARRRPGPPRCIYEHVTCIQSGGIQIQHEACLRASHSPEPSR